MDDTGFNYGGDIFKSSSTRNNGTQNVDYGNYTGQGLKSTLSYQQIRIGYLMNPAWRLMFEIGYTRRQIDIKNGSSEIMNMVHLGFKTALYNQYLDF